MPVQLDPLSITALATAVLTAGGTLYRIHTERAQKEIEERGRITGAQIEASAGIEEINTQRMNTLFEKYEQQIKRFEKNTEDLLAKIESMQTEIKRLRGEVMKLRTHNAYLKGILEKDPAWINNVDFDIDADIMNQIRANPLTAFDESETES